MQPIAKTYRMGSILGGIAFALLCHGTLGAQGATPSTLSPLAGAWEGTMQSGLTTRQIKVWLDRDGGGRFQVVGVTTDRNPVRDVRNEKGEVSFVFPSAPPMVFRGRLAGDAIRGHYEELGRKQWFRLAKARP